MDQPPRRARFSRGLKILAVLAIGVIVALAGLYQVFSRQARAGVESAEIPGAADAAGARAAVYAGTDPADAAGWARGFGEPATRRSRDGAMLERVGGLRQARGVLGLQILPR
ncbi:MAG: hypothetical protein KY464_12975, partial [Gemmatimonadetes bacterium]|nr:hypothetical protein [Gemmatimonadota bacterium]